jgi:hypothetical protein
LKSSSGSTTVSVSEPILSSQEKPKESITSEGGPHRDTETLPESWLLDPNPTLEKLREIFHNRLAKITSHMKPTKTRVIEEDETHRLVKLTLQSDSTFVTGSDEQHSNLLQFVRQMFSPLRVGLIFQFDIKIRIHVNLAFSSDVIACPECQNECTPDDSLSENEENERNNNDHPKDDENDNTDAPSFSTLVAGYNFENDKTPETSTKYRYNSIEEKELEDDSSDDFDDSSLDGDQEKDPKLTEEKPQKDISSFAGTWFLSYMCELGYITASKCYHGNVEGTVQKSFCGLQPDIKVNIDADFGDPSLFHLSYKNSEYETVQFVFKVDLDKALSII